MTAVAARRRIIPKGTRWLLWCAYFAAWTFMLLAPAAWLPSWLAGGGDVTGGLTWSKLGHIGGYAVLAAGTLLLPASRSIRWALLATVSAHGFISEYLQFTITELRRHGCWLDVGIDHIGIAAGIVLGGLGRWLWLARARKASPQQADDHGRREDQNADLLRYR